MSDNSQLPEQSPTEAQPPLDVPAGSACLDCGLPGRHVRVRNFVDEDADVWECENPRCVNFNRLWHTPRPKTEIGALRCALLELVAAEKASRDNFDSNAIERIEQAMKRAERVLFPERFPPNTPDHPRRDT